MPDVITACGRSLEYPLRLERLLGGLRYSGNGFLVADLEEWRDTPPPAATVRLIVETLAGAMRLPYRVGLKQLPDINGTPQPGIYRKQRGTSEPVNGRQRILRAPGGQPQATSKYRWESLEVGQRREYSASSARLVTSFREWAKARGVDRRRQIKTRTLPNGRTEVRRIR